MNDREVRLECIRIASENIRAALASGSQFVLRNDLPSAVQDHADKLYDYVWSAKKAAA